MWLCQHGTHMALMGKEHGLITPHDLLVLSAFLRRELSGMIHWRTIKNPSNPQHPIHSLRKTHQEVLTHWYWWNMDLSMENNDVYLYSMVYPKLIGLNLHITWGSSFDGFPTTLPWKSIREVAEMRRTSAQSSWWHLHRIPVSHISSSDGIITYKLYIYIYDIYIYIHYICIYYIYIIPRALPYISWYSSYPPYSLEDFCHPLHRSQPRPHEVPAAAPLAARGGEEGVVRFGQGSKRRRNGGCMWIYYS